LQTYRDLAIAGLMLFCGLRSREIRLLRRCDVGFLQEELRVFGKGNKDRVLPLPTYARKALLAYLELERPKSAHDALFVNLKGPTRGSSMTAAGVRELFRYHRRRSGITAANPHRFRHTFAADMVREGMSLPVLMRLMGHTSIEMTLRYVNLSAEDVREEFERAFNRINRQGPDGLPRNP
jgi:site-specific recombinase XerD